MSSTEIQKIFEDNKLEDLKHFISRGIWHLSIFFILYNLPEFLQQQLQPDMI